MSDGRWACPDGGKCRHECQVGCYRVEQCAPLTGVYDDHTWPESVTSLVEALDQKREELGRTQADVSALLDEVYALRLMLAYEAEVLEATLDYKTFPKSRRSVQQNQVARMQLVATGRASAQAMSERSYPSGSLRGIRRQVGLVVAGNWRNGWLNIKRDDEGDQDE